VCKTYRSKWTVANFHARELSDVFNCFVIEDIKEVLLVLIIWFSPV